MSTRTGPMPHYLAAERAAAARLAAERDARIEYTGLPWARRLVTPPPVGWPGGYIGRAVGWCRAHRRPARRTEPTPLETGVWAEPASRL